MKLYATTLLIASLTASAAAFSAVAPKKSAAKAASGGGPSLDPIDRSLKGIDADADTFDPTAGDSPALTRNNNDEVWVPQVRNTHILWLLDPLLTLSLSHTYRYLCRFFSHTLLLLLLHDTVLR